MSCDHDTHQSMHRYAAEKKIELERWQAVLGAGDCSTGGCTHDCNQGRHCTCAAQAPVTGLITSNSDGSTADSEDLLDDTSLLIGQGIALIVAVVSVIFYACL